MREGAMQESAMRKGTSRRWIEIGFTVLRPEERTARLPEDTQRLPYRARLRGFVSGPCQVGDEVEVETLSGRRVWGEVIDTSPRFAHDFGKPIPELIEAGLEAKELLRSLEARSQAAGGAAPSNSGDTPDAAIGAAPVPAPGAAPSGEADPGPHREAGGEVTL